MVVLSLDQFYEYIIYNLKFLLLWHGLITLLTSNIAKQILNKCAAREKEV